MEKTRCTKDECQQTPSTNGKPETGNVRLKCDARKRFGEEIGSIYDSGGVVD